jgi:WD40 repeat protein
MFAPTAEPAGSDLFVWDYPTSGASQVNEVGDYHIDQTSQISQNGYWLIGEDNSLWDLRCVIQDITCKPISIPALEGSSVGFSPDSLHLSVSFTKEEEGSYTELHQIWNLKEASGLDQAAPKLVYDAAASSDFETWTYWSIVQPITRRIYLVGGGGGGGGGGPGTYKVDYGIEVLNSSTGPTFQSLILRGHEEFVYRQLISPSGRWGITISTDSIKLWDLEGVQSNPFTSAVNLPIDTAQISQMGFTMDERFLVILINNERLEFLPMRVEDLIAQACRSVGRNFIINEWQRYFLNADYRQTCENLPEHPSVLIESSVAP